MTTSCSDRDVAAPIHADGVFQNAQGDRADALAVAFASLVKRRFSSSVTPRMVSCVGISAWYQSDADLHCHQFT
jgi:hypothetical protein